MGDLESAKKTYMTGPKPMTPIKNGKLCTNLKRYVRVAKIFSWGLAAGRQGGFSKIESPFLYRSGIIGALWNVLRVQAFALLCNMVYCRGVIFIVDPHMLFEAILMYVLCVKFKSQIVKGLHHHYS